MKYVYNVYDNDEQFSVRELMEELENFEYCKVNPLKLHYVCDLLGYYNRFKLTAKGVSCYDHNGKYHYFKQTANVPFYKVNFMYDVWEG